MRHLKYFKESISDTYTMYSGITMDNWNNVWKDKKLDDRITNVTSDINLAYEFSYNFNTGNYEDIVVEISNIPINAFIAVRDDNYQDDDDFESIENLDINEKQNIIKYNNLFLVNLYPYRDQIKTKLRSL